MKIDSRLVLSRRSERGATDILGKNGEYLEGVDNFICVCRGDRGDPCGTPSLTGASWDSNLFDCCHLTLSVATIELLPRHVQLGTNQEIEQAVRLISHSSLDNRLLLSPVEDVLCNCVNLSTKLSRFGANWMALVTPPLRHLNRSARTLLHYPFKVPDRLIGTKLIMQTANFIVAQAIGTV